MHLGVRVYAFSIFIIFVKVLLCVDPLFFLLFMFVNIDEGSSSSPKKFTVVKNFESLSVLELNSFVLNSPPQVNLCNETHPAY